MRALAVRKKFMFPAIKKRKCFPDVKRRIGANFCQVMRLFILLADCVMKQEHDHWLINWLPQKLYSDMDQTKIQVKFIPGIFSRFYYYFDLLTY